MSLLVQEVALLSSCLYFYSHTLILSILLLFPVLIARLAIYFSWTQMPMDTWRDTLEIDKIMGEDLRNPTICDRYEVIKKKLNCEFHFILILFIFIKTYIVVGTHVSSDSIYLLSVPNRIRVSPILLTFSSFSSPPPLFPLPPSSQSHRSDAQSAAEGGSDGQQPLASHHPG
jgi:hypothetical protein